MKGRTGRGGRALRVLAAVAALAIPAAARAQQQALVQQCAAAPAAAQEFCLTVAQGVQIAEPRLGMAFSGGNPIPGTSSTLGMRVPGSPRISIGVRATGAYATLPPIQGNDADIKVVAPSVSADVGVGIFEGFRLAPTLGGFGSVDLLGGVGVVPVSGGGFQGGAPVGWGVGARLGVLRESFTVPGISISGMYRRVGKIEYGDAALVQEASGGALDSAYFRLDGMSDLSVRATIGKRFFVLGTTAGIGWDRYSADLAAAGHTTGATTTTATSLVPQVNTFQVQATGLREDRWTAFADLSYTTLIATFVLEGGWQSGGTPASLQSPTGYEHLVRDGAPYASLAFRLTI